MSDFSAWHDTLAAKSITSGHIVESLAIMPGELVDESLHYLFDNYVREGSSTLNRSSGYWSGVICNALDKRDDEWVGLSYEMLKEMYTAGKLDWSRILKNAVRNSYGL